MGERNRHPVDRLADVRSKIRRLEAEERNFGPICSNTPMTWKVWNTSLPGATTQAGRRVL